MAKSNPCAQCGGVIPSRVLAAYPGAIYCSRRCEKSGAAFSIYGDSLLEQQNGERFEREQAAAKSKPRTILRKAGSR